METSSALLVLALVAGVLPSGPAGASPAPCSGLGCEAWVATYDGPAHQLDTPRNSGFAGPVQSIALSPDGRRVFVTGGSSGGFPSEGGTGYDYATVAYDAATGDERWVARYPGVGPDDSAWASAIAASPDGSRVFVTGNVTSPSPVNWNIDTVAYDADGGQQLWSIRYDRSVVDRVWSIGVAPDGSTVYLVGESRAEGKVTPDILTVAYDAATGAERWVARYDGPAGDRDEGRWLAVAPDGSRVFVTGRSTGTGTSFDYATIAYDAATGTERWVARYNGPANGWDESTALAAASDGSRVFVTGQSGGSGTSSDYATVAYDAATGAQGWVTRYDGSLDIAQAVAVSHDVSIVVVTGYSLGDYGTVAYDAASGAERWVALYDGPPGNSSDNGYAVAFSPDDSFVYVTGESPNDTHYDIATVGYEASNGFPRGVARFNGPENFQDAGFGLAVAPDGSRVYVNGESWHSTSPGVGDYATLAYEASALSGLGVSAVELSVDGDEVSVRGTALFGGQGPVLVGQDVAGDAFGGAAASAAGLDLRRLTISQPDAEDPAIELALGLEGMAGGGVPEGALYAWGFRVAGSSDGWRVETMRSRAAATGGTEPWAALLACPAAGPCAERTRLAASYDEETARITVRVPLAAIDGDPGETIEPWSSEGEPVRVLASPAGLATAPQVVDAATPQSYAVPKKSVRLGIAPAGTPADEVVFGAPVALTPAGGTTGFEGTVSRAGLSGPAEVWVEVCFGSLCSATSSEIELPVTG